MNARILELAKQAGLKFPSETALSPPEVLFAELVALESIKVCDAYAAKILRFSQFGSNAATDCAVLIKEHFGIVND